MNPAQMAGAPQPTSTPQGPVGGVDPAQIKAALQAAIKQCVNPQGYVDMNKLIQVWPQISQQMGLNIPFQAVLQMVQQDPSLIEDIIAQMGLAGIIVDGKMISAEQLLSQSQGGGAMAGGAPQPGGQPPMPPQGA